MNVKLKKIEYHSVHSHFTYDMRGGNRNFGSVDRFKEIISHLGDDCEDQKRLVIHQQMRKMIN